MIQIDFMIDLHFEKIILAAILKLLRKLPIADYTSLFF